MSRHWMPLYIADYLKDTSHLRALESGAYMHLIMAYWVSGGLPKNERQLATIAKMTDDEWTEHRDTLQAFFSPDWTHKRIDKEMAEADEKIAKKSAAGKAGGKASAEQRASNRSTDATADVQAEAKQTSTHSHSPKQVSKKEGADAPPRSQLKDRKRATRFPDGLTANRAAQEAAGLSIAEGEREFTKFRYHAHEKGRTCVDWGAAEANWYLKAAEFMGRKPKPVSSGVPVSPDEEAVRFFKAVGRWHRDYGPEPGQLGCRVASDILQKFGYGEKAA